MNMAFDPKVLGKRINELRKRDSIQQEKLAEALEKSVPMISYYESGKRVPPPDVIFVMCKIFRVSSDYLLGLTDNPERRAIGALGPNHDLCPLNCCQVGESKRPAPVVVDAAVV